MIPRPEHDDIMYRPPSPRAVHLACFAAIWTASRGPRLDRGRALLAAHLCDRGGAITAISRIAPMRPAGPSSSRSRSWRRARRKERAVVGPPSTPPPSGIRIPTRRAFAAPQKGLIYSHVGWVFSRRHDLTTWSRSRTSPAIPSSCGCTVTELAPAIVLALVCLAVRRLVRPGGRVLLEHGRGLSRTSASTRSPMVRGRKRS